ncbi:hypothetical protein TNIN_286641 [Trichonephila inaurata madagascariensis]|uniref:Uncharacterized protein n=1 Tax=Trichonephila inaurata madagascariensis TaxID=2747483 RepID=A0A8X7C4K2_9ARAC|nr:hypothetical protein TNIN_286641 [Trichonephila inaurata madagascariensis]
MGNIVQKCQIKGKMFSSKFSLLLLGFVILGTCLNIAQSMPTGDVDDYNKGNDIEDEEFEEELPFGIDSLDDEDVEEGEAEERNFPEELDAEIEEEEEEAIEKKIAEDEEEEEKDADEETDDDEKDLIEEEKKDLGDVEIADAEEEEEEKHAEEEEHDEEEEDEYNEEEEEEKHDDEGGEEVALDAEVDEDAGSEEKKFPYTWYDRVRKFFKGRK